MTTVWLSLFILSSLVFIACYVWLLVLAWRESTTWGLISTFVPFGVVGFVVKFWESSKTQVILCVATLIISTVTGLGFSVSKVNSSIGGNNGGADLWTDTSGFEAMDSSDEDIPNADTTPETPPGQTEVKPEEEFSGADPLAETPPSENPALDELANADTTDADDEPTAPGFRRRKVVSLENLPKLEGERVALILSDGQRIFGVVEQVSASKVVIRRIVGGGSILFTLKREDIKEIQTRLVQ